MSKSGQPENVEVDVYRDTPVRLLGYANEVGESFRALVNVWLVRLSYVIASAYVVADTMDKSKKTYRTIPHTNDNVRWVETTKSAVDTLIWQSLASVAIPGFTINRICAVSLFMLGKGTTWSLVRRKWTTTAIGLGCIPFIVHPIDRSVDFLMDNSYRIWFSRATKN